MALSKQVIRDLQIEMALCLERADAIAKVLKGEGMQEGPAPGPRSRNAPVNVLAAESDKLFSPHQTATRAEIIRILEPGSDLPTQKLKYTVDSMLRHNKGWRNVGYGKYEKVDRKKGN